MASDGKIIIDTKLDTSGFEKDVDTASKKVANDLGKSTEKAMKQAESSIKNVGKAVNSIDFSKVAKQMDSISNNIEKTSSKIDAQKERLNNLKKAYENATDIKSKNTIETEMKNAEASIAKLESKLTSLGNKKIKLNSLIDASNGLDGNFTSASMKITEDLDKVEKKAEETGKKVKKSLSDSAKNISLGDSVTKIGKSLNDVGNTLTTHVTAPVTLLGVAAAKVGMDFDSGMSRVKAISGATGEEFTKLHDQALQLGADTAFSAKQAAEGMENLASAGFNTNEIMSAMPGMLDLAASSGETIATSSDIAASALRGFGLQATDAGHVADVLAVNASKTNAQVADTGEALKYVATNAHTAGWSLEETVAAIGDLSNYGIKGTQAGTTLREMLVRLASPSKEAAGDMKKLGFNAFDSQGKMKSLSTIIGEYSKALQGKTDQQKQDYTATIFGQEAMSGLLALVQGGSGALDDLTQSYKNSDGAAKDMAKTMQDNAGSSIEQMMGSIETAAIKLEEVAAPTITKIAGEIEELANDFSELSPSTQEFIIKAALLAVALGPVAKTLGAVETIGGKFIGIAGSIATKFGLIGTAATATAEGTTAAGVAAEGGATALGGLTLAGGIAATGIAALAVGIAGYITYQDLMSKSCATSTDDLNIWEKAVNSCTGNVVKSKEELQKSGLIYKDFGEGVSNSFKDGIEKATKSYHDFEMTLTGANSDEKMSSENQSKVSNTINSMIEAAKSTINSRKSEVQKELSDMFNAGDGKIDEKEQKVIDAAGGEADAKLKKVESIQKQLTDRWNKAIQEHGKLSESDVEIIKNYMQQIQQIQAEVSAKNDAESTFSKNQYSERLNGISAEDATKEYQSSSEDLKKKFENERATYKTGMDELQKEIQQYTSENKTEEAKNAQDELDAKDKEYKESIKKEQDYLKEYRDMLYKKNPQLEGNMNEIDGSMLSPDDKKVKAKLENVEKQYTDVANATETGMQHVYDAENKRWHDVYTVVDQATGKVISTYDEFTKDSNGYTTKYKDQAHQFGLDYEKEMKQVFDSSEEFKEKLQGGGDVSTSGWGKINDNNELTDATGNVLTKLYDVKKAADGTKEAVISLNGQRIEIKTNADGVITNLDSIYHKLGIIPEDKTVTITADGKVEIIDVIKGKIDNLPDKKGCKISIDGKEETNVDAILEKLGKLPPDTKTDITINGQQISTVKEAIEALNKLPKETTTQITVNGEQVSTADDALKKFNEIKESDPNATIEINGEQISTAEEAKAKLDEITNSNPHTTVQVNTGDANAKLQSILNKVNSLDGKDVTITTKIIGAAAEVALGAQKNYTGSNTSTTGLSYVNEHGYETANSNNVSMLGDGLAFIREHHYTGGDGINDHMTTVDEMHNDITNQVGSTIGQTIAKLHNGFSNEQTIMKDIAHNTKDTVTNVDISNQLTKKNAEKMVGMWNGKGGNFTNLQTEITNANSDKEKADKMKVEDDYAYKNKKAELDALEKQIDNTEDEASKKSLEKQKKNLEDEVNAEKDAAEKRVQAAKDAADQEVKIATEKKEKLTKLAEAVTTAIKNQLTQEKDSYDTAAQAELTTMEDNYNKQTAALDANLKKKTDAIDSQIKDLEQQSTDTSRSDTVTEASNKIAMLTAKMNNDASYADRQSYLLQIKDAQNALTKQQNEWSINDQKQSLEDQKTELSTKEEKQKKSLEKQYNDSKAAKEKEIKSTDEYYDKLLETDSINAQARYKLLNSSSQDLVTLLNSYDKNWQNAGQSLADSLVDGLNSQKESVQKAVNDMISLKGSTASSDYYYNGDGQKVSYATGQIITGYANGTDYNPSAGYYKTNEDGPEMTTNGDVAYVSKGASIKNAMQTQQFISSEIASQVASMKAAVMQSQQDTLKSIFASTLGNNVTNNSGNTLNFNVEHYHQHTDQDIQDLSHELGFLSFREKRC